MAGKREFIFPMNYKNKEKFLGIIDYKIVVTILGFASGLFYLLKNIEISLTTKVTVFILIMGFFSILLIVGVNGENMLDFLWFVGKYFLKERTYVYRKTEKKGRNKICENLLKRIFQ